MHCYHLVLITDYPTWADDRNKVCLLVILLPWQTEKNIYSAKTKNLLSRFLQQFHKQATACAIFVNCSLDSLREAAADRLSLT